MKDHRPKLDVPGIGTWFLNAPSGEAEFISDRNYVPIVRGNIWKFFEGGNQNKFIDPQHRFILLEAQDEMLRGDASGELKTVASLNRQENGGLRRSKFISDPLPIFIFEHGLLVFDSDGQLRWSRNDLRLDQFLSEVKNGRVYYHSESDGNWSYDLFTGHKNAD
ncbi:MAG TPA: hypothetical protein VI685_20910 [Candidatus Angelobacter sp.]